STNSATAPKSGTASTSPFPAGALNRGGGAINTAPGTPSAATPAVRPAPPTPAPRGSRPAAAPGRSSPRRTPGSDRGTAEARRSPALAAPAGPPEPTVAAASPNPAR